MMTVISTMKLRSGTEEAWDAAISQRFESAQGRPGWVSGQLLNPLDAPDTRVIVGTWERREDWEAWHNDPAFLDQRSRLEDLQSEPNTVTWFEVVADARTGD